MGKLIIDTHSHLWLRQDTQWNGLVIQTKKGNGSRSAFLGEERQMLPPFMIDGRNTAEVFLSNMDYAQVGAAVVVQEFIDGIQNDYLKTVQQQYPDRFFCYAMVDYLHDGFCEQAVRLMTADGFKGMAIPGHRLLGRKLTEPEMMDMFRWMETNGKYLSITLADGDEQVAELRDVIAECPRLKVAIGHLGMSWLYNTEFYPFPSAVRAIREAADLVGMEKLMWGSDYPRTITAITYRMSYDFIFRSDLLTQDEQAAFLGENARHFYGFKNLPELPYIKNMSE